MTEGADTPETIPGWGRWGIAVLFLLAFLMVQVVGAVLVSGVGALLIGSDRTTDAFGELTSLVGVSLLVGIELVVAAGGLALAAAWPGLQRTGLGATRDQLRRGWIAVAPITLLVLVPVLLAGASSNDTLVDSSVSLELGVLLVVFAVLVGFAEEVFFRGLVVEALGGARHAAAATIGSATLFGIPHVLASDGAVSGATLLNTAGVTIAIGIPFALVRLRCNALVPLIASHALIDIAAFLHTASVTATGSPDAGDVIGTLVPASLVAGAYVVWFRGGQARRSRDASG